VAYRKDKRQKLNKLYVEERLTMNDACKQVGISVATGRKWRLDEKEKGNDWNTARSAVILSNVNQESMANDILSIFFLSFKDAIEKMKEEDIEAEKRAIIMARMADSYAKITSATHKNNPTASELSSALSFIKMLTEFIMKNYPQHSKIFLEILEPFGLHMSKELHKK